MVLYWKNMYIVKKLKVSRGTCWDKQMPDCRKLKDWWLKAKVWSFLYDIGCLKDVLAVKLPKRHWEDVGIGVETDKFLERLSGTQKKNFFWDSTDPIQFHMGTVSLIIYHMLIHTICYHIINHTDVLIIPRLHLAKFYDILNRQLD